MNSSEARKYLDGEISLDEVSQPSQTNDDTPPANPNPAGEAGSEEQVETQTDESQTQSTEQLDTSNQDGKPDDDGTATQTDDGKPDDKKTPQLNPKEKPDKLPYPKATKEEIEKYKANKAFIKQKQKYQTKINAMQSQIDSMKAQLAKFNAVDPTSLGDDQDKKMDLKVAKGVLKNQISNLESQRDSVMYEQEAEEAEQIHQQRVDACFDDESSKSHYFKLLENGRDKFVQFLGKYDPDNTILEYLDDSDISPLMVQVLMTNPEVLKRVVNIKNPLNKVVELRSIENRINLDRRIRSVKTPRTQATQTNKSPAGKLPSTGSQTNPSGSNAEPKVRDANYWHNYLAQHS